MHGQRRRGAGRRRAGAALALSAAIAAALAAGCGSDSDGDPESSSAPAIAPLAPGGLAQIIDELGDTLGEAPQLLEVVATEATARVQIVAPDTTDEGEEWTYGPDGQLSGPDPVEFSPFEQREVAEKTFTVDDVDLDAIPGLVTDAEMLPIGDPELESVVIEQFLPFDEEVTFRVNVFGSDGMGQIVADSSGEVTETTP